MIQSSFRRFGFWGKLLTYLFVTFLFLIVGMSIVTVVNYFAVDLDAGKTDTIFYLKISQLILALFAFVMPPLVLAYLWYDNPGSSLGLKRLPTGKQVLYALVALIVGSPFISMLAHMNEQMILPGFLSGLEEIFRAQEATTEKLTKEMLDVHTLGGYLLNMLVIAVLPAVGEELYCRGGLFKIISTKLNRHVTVWVVAIIFSLMHFQMYGFLPRAILGGMLGYLLIWSGSLWLPIIVHFLNNAFIVTFSYLYGADKALDAYENINGGDIYFYGVTSGLVAVWFMWLLYKQTKKEKGSSIQQE